MLDSSVAIAAERMGQTAYEMLEAVSRHAGDTETVLERAHGLARADTPQRRADRQRFLDDLLAGMPVHPVTTAVALRAGQIDGRLEAAGEKIALADLLILRARRLVKRAKKQAEKKSAQTLLRR